MPKGYVYILTNPAYPGLVKIGMTTGTPESRAASLQTTGVPFPFEVAHSVFSPDCAHLEAEIHEHYCEVRVSESREFFRVDAADAAVIMDELHIEQVRNAVFEYTEDHVLVQEFEFVDPSTFSILGRILGRNAFQIAQILGEVRPDDDHVDLAVLADRYDQRIERNRANRKNESKEPSCIDLRIVQ